MSGHAEQRAHLRTLADTRTLGRMRWALDCECQLARDGHALASGGAA